MKACRTNGKGGEVYIDLNGKQVDLTTCDFFFIVAANKDTPIGKDNVFVTSNATPQNMNELADLVITSLFTLHGSIDMVNKLADDKEACIDLVEEVLG